MVNRNFFEFSEFSFSSVRCPSLGLLTMTKAGVDGGDVLDAEVDGCAD